MLYSSLNNNEDEVYQEGICLILSVWLLLKSDSPTWLDRSEHYCLCSCQMLVILYFGVAERTRKKVEVCQGKSIPTT